MLTFNDFKNSTQSQDIIYNENYCDYLDAISLIESYYSNQLSENIITELPDKLKDKFDFIKSIADVAKMDISELISIIKFPSVFEFFDSIKFNLAKFYNILKQGYKSYIELEHEVSKFAANQKIMKWTTANLELLDDYLMNNKALHRITGVAASGILLFMWMHQSHTGNIDHDFNADDIVNAMKGEYELADLFGGHEGAKRLMLFAVGITVHVTFPWPTPSDVSLIIGLIRNLRKTMKVRIENEKANEPPKLIPRPHKGTTSKKRTTESFMW